MKRKNTAETMAPLPADVAGGKRSVLKGNEGSAIPRIYQRTTLRVVDVEAEYAARGEMLPADQLPTRLEEVKLFGTPSLQEWEDLGVRGLVALDVGSAAVRATGKPSGDPAVNEAVRVAMRDVDKGEEVVRNSRIEVEQRSLMIRQRIEERGLDMTMPQSEVRVIETSAQGLRAAGGRLQARKDELTEAVNHLVGSRLGLPAPEKTSGAQDENDVPAFLRNRGR
jgi:hypothetical protein